MPLKRQPTNTEVEQLLQFIAIMSIYITDDYQVEMKQYNPTECSMVVKLYKDLTGDDLDIIS